MIEFLCRNLPSRAGPEPRLTHISFYHSFLGSQSAGACEGVPAGAGPERRISLFHLFSESKWRSVGRDPAAQPARGAGTRERPCSKRSTDGTQTERRRNADGRGGRGGAFIHHSYIVLPLISGFPKGGGVHPSAGQGSGTYVRTAAKCRTYVRRVQSTECRVQSTEYPPLLDSLSQSVGSRWSVYRHCIVYLIPSLFEYKLERFM